MTALIKEPEPSMLASGDTFVEKSKWSEIMPRVIPLEPLPDHIKLRYKRLALVTTAEQIAKLENDDNTLIVSCDWLLWQKAMMEKRHCLYYERGLLEWDEPDNLRTHLHLRANDWVFENGKDLTTFLGVSLGKLFGSVATHCLCNHLRLERALRKLIERFRPEEILYFDFMSEVNVLDDDLRIQVVASIAKEYDVLLTDCADIATETVQEVTENPAKLSDHGFFVRMLLALYSLGIETATTLRCFTRNKQRRILVVAITHIVQPLFESFSSNRVTPMFFTRILPKRPGTLIQSLRKGILLVKPKNIPMTNAAKTRLKEILTDALRVSEAPSEGAEATIRAYIKKHVIESGKMSKVAADVWAAEQLLRRYKPARIVVDGERNPPTRHFIELGRALNIPVDHTWHSPLTPKNLKLDALSGDQHSNASVSRCLTWGSMHEDWLDKIDADQPRVRIGSPLSNIYLRKEAPPATKKKNALILQYTPNLADMKGLNTNSYSYFVDIVRLLRERGYENVRFKLHPGPGRWTKKYYQLISETFHLNCPVLKTDPFEECVEWADIVVGPALTGAMFETLAGGVPYYAFLMPPHTMDESYFGDYPLLASVDELSKALDQPINPEAGRKLLNALYSIDEFPSGSEQFWDVMDKDFV